MSPDPKASPPHLADGAREANRRSALEGGTDFLAYATGASAHFAWCNCCRVVVAGDADHPGARADRPQCEAALRLLRTVPRRADAARFDDPHFARADRAGPGATRQNLGLRAHL